MTTKYSAVHRDRFGRAVPGATVTVYQSGTATKATLTGAPNPLTTRSDGHYEFSVADGLYDIVIDGECQVGVLIGSDSALAPVPLKSYTVATLPASPAAGQIAYASNGCKNGELTGAGTGVLVFSDSTNAWMACDTGTAVGA